MKTAWYILETIGYALIVLFAIGLFAIGIFGGEITIKTDGLIELFK